jgi:hypothetical protein
MCFGINLERTGLFFPFPLSFPLLARRADLSYGRRRERVCKPSAKAAEADPQALPPSEEDDPQGDSAQRFRRWSEKNKPSSAVNRFTQPLGRYNPSFDTVGKEDYAVIYFDELDLTGSPKRYAKMSTRAHKDGGMWEPVKPEAPTALKQR